MLCRVIGYGSYATMRVTTFSIETEAVIVFPDNT